MVSLEPARVQVQVLHEYDTCCFSPHDRHAFRALSATFPPKSGAYSAILADKGDQNGNDANLGLYMIVTFQYSSTTSSQVSYHIQYLSF
jgi:hypothetical protein